MYISPFVQVSIAWHTIVYCMFGKQLKRCLPIYFLVSVFESRISLFWLNISLIVSNLIFFWECLFCGPLDWKFLLSFKCYGSILWTRRKQLEAWTCLWLGKSKCIQKNYAAKLASQQINSKAFKFMQRCFHMQYLIPSGLWRHASHCSQQLQAVAANRSISNKYKQQKLQLPIPCQHQCNLVTKATLELLWLCCSFTWWSCSYSLGKSQ